jgi:hypothetical protein
VEAIDSSPLKPKCWRRYVDDVFAVWPHGQGALKDFLGHLNSRHTNITFSVELERDRELPFLDIMVIRGPEKLLGHSVFLKATHTDRYLQVASHHPPAHKRSVNLDGQRILSVTRPAGPANYNMLGSFSEPTAAPCRRTAERLYPDRPREVPGTQTTGHTSHTSRGPLIASPGCCRKHDIHTIQKPINKMASGFNSTRDS